jgi:putative DNA methylase
LERSFAKGRGIMNREELETEKTFIEMDFPIKDISEASAKEKSTRHGNISSLHAWWARKPLTGSRGVIYSALSNAPTRDSDLRERMDFLQKLTFWENANDWELIKRAQKDILERYHDSPPKTLDCFAGGGGILLESLRLGCDSFGLELNPVAVLIERATAEFPQLFNAGEIKGISGESHPKPNGNLTALLDKWGEWILENVSKEIDEFYPKVAGQTPMAYFWIRFVECENPSCRTKIPIIWEGWLCKNDHRKTAIKLVLDKKRKTVDLKIVRGQEIDFDPSKGTVRKGSVQCPLCDSTIDPDKIREAAISGKLREEPRIALISSDHAGKEYFLLEGTQLRAHEAVISYLKKKIATLKWEYSPIPDEPLSTPTGKIYQNGGPFFVHLQPVLYGCKTWGIYSMIVKNWL